jgi:hypothetical protein
MFQVKYLSKSSRAIFSQENSNFFQSNGKVKWEIARNMNTKSKWVVSIFFRRTFRTFYGMISTVFVTLLLVFLLKLLF